ncbi:MAG: hypothetical protein ISP72_02175 [Flavobacteriaceae bacterium]|nr:hypothetical protein [Flavobacteriaceae bacterium]
MKNILAIQRPLIVVLLIIFYQFGNSQMVVTDPGAVGQIIKGIKEGKKRLEELKDQTKFLEESIKTVTKVNRKVQEIKA